MSKEIFSSRYYNDSALVSLWRFEGNSTDSKGSNNGTDTAITYNASYGKFGQGALFNGTTSVIQCPYLNYSTGTISLWFNATSITNGPQFVVSNVNTDNSGSWIEFGCLSTGEISVIQLNTTYKTSAGLVSTGSWNNVVFTQNGSGIKVYLNGERKTFDGGASTLWLNSISGNQFCIGALKRGSQIYTPLNGSLDDVAVFSRALSDNEIYELYHDLTFKYRPGSLGSML